MPKTKKSMLNKFCFGFICLWQVSATALLLSPALFCELHLPTLTYGKLTNSVLAFY